MRAFILLLLLILLSICATASHPAVADEDEAEEEGELQDLELVDESEAHQTVDSIKQSVPQRQTSKAADETGDNRTFLRNGQAQQQNHSTSMARRNYFGWLDLSNANGVNAASCYDSRLSSFINNGLYYYSHNMGQLSSYIIDQIKRAGYSGFWFVHAAMIGGQTQGLQWQSQSNGDIFAPSSRHGCFYHDTQTYVVIVRY
uniref:SCP domain-containing protein n=1 Tax=Globodera rostochiensis TaxID=31243 RepID=A0A914I730_GLORO